MPRSDLETFRLKRVAIIGAGPMGTSLAAILGRRVPVVIVCPESPHAAEMFESGARVTGAVEAQSTPIVVRRIADLVAVGGASVVFVATKTTAIPAVAKELAAVLDRVGDQPGAPFVVSYQNGIDPGLQMRALLGDPRVLRMVLNFGAVFDEHGAVRATLNEPPHAIGSDEARHEPVCRVIAGALTEAGFETRYDDRIEDRVWMKGILNACMSPVAALVNATIGQVLDSPAREIVDRLLREAIDVAHAEGRDLGRDPLASAYETYERGRGHVPSMVEDIRAGRESEVGQLNRQVIEHARRLGVPTPTHAIIDALIETFDWKIYAGSGGKRG